MSGGSLAAFASLAPCLADRGTSIRQRGLKPDLPCVDASLFPDFFATVALLLEAEGQWEDADEASDEPDDAEAGEPPEGRDGKRRSRVSPRGRVGREEHGEAGEKRVAGESVDGGGAGADEDTPVRPMSSTLGVWRLS